MTKPQPIATDRIIERDGRCPRDGILLRDHLRCSVCHILIGPLHYERHAIERGGRVLCGGCARGGRDARADD